jgi:surfeit locus 1 family protein
LYDVFRARSIGVRSETGENGMSSMWRTALTARWLGLLVVALVLAAVMTVMGVWQFNVYRSKTAAATASKAQADPVPLQSLFPLDAGLPAKAVGRRVSVSGTWAAAGDQIFVADRVHEGRNGYWVVTPLLLDERAADGSQGAVPVIRGWVSSPSARAAAAPTGRASVVGAVVASEAEDSSAAAARGRVLPSLRIATMVSLVDYRLYDGFVMQESSDPAMSGGPAVVPAPPPPTDHAGLRNVAYAFQWWIFAAFALFMWWRMMRDAANDPAEIPAVTDLSEVDGGAGAGSTEPATPQRRTVSTS